MSQFNSLKAISDLKYLEENRTFAREFADENLALSNINFVHALKIKGELGEKIDTDVLKAALSQEELQSEVAFYLAKVSIPEMDQHLIENLNSLLETMESNVDKVYWLIFAILKTATSRAKFFLRGILTTYSPKNDLLKLAFEEVGKSV